MSYAYSKDNLIEQTAVSIFKDLKWEPANVCQEARDVLLFRRLNQLMKIYEQDKNPLFPTTFCFLDD